MKYRAEIPVLGFAAYSGTGKTTLLKQLLPLLHQHSIRTAVIKHAHHDFEIDHEGKDSYELRKAGANQVLVGSKKRWALIVENNPGEEPGLADFIRRLDQRQLDLILVEGFKPEEIPKIELIRSGIGNQPFYPKDDSIIAVATDKKLEIATGLPVLDLNDPLAITDFILSRFFQKNVASTMSGN